ncbi:hypothetical protein AAFF_G00438370 [Aldrovandia affinis]|uniref:Uncharacterized protein n=1 Tax=Aldrovandia affinis TaxID=143900 RepID=A0AAD7S7T2_9TELE|nr:hypothetical protein AAFF_G00438370 [Aldrovandia affinis]
MQWQNLLEVPVFQYMSRKRHGAHHTSSLVRWISAVVRQIFREGVDCVPKGSVATGRRGCSMGFILPWTFRVLFHGLFL